VDIVSFGYSFFYSQIDKDSVPKECQSYWYVGYVNLGAFV